MDMDIDILALLISRSSCFLLLFFLVELNVPHGYDTYLSLPFDG